MLELKNAKFGQSFDEKKSSLLIRQNQVKNSIYKLLLVVEFVEKPIGATAAVTSG